MNLVFFSVDTAVNQKNTCIRFIYYHLIFIVFQKKKSILTPLNARLFQTFDVVEIYNTSQLIFPVDAKLTSIILTKQNKPFTICSTLINNN
mgnify:CR=1 FL=1